MSDPVKTPDIEEIAVLCPHVASKDIPIGFAVTEGALIPIDPKHPLILCPQCWQIVRAAVYDSMVAVAARSLPKRPT